MDTMDLTGIPPHRGMSTTNQNPVLLNDVTASHSNNPDFLQPQHNNSRLLPAVVMGTDINTGGMVTSSGMFSSGSQAVMMSSSGSPASPGAAGAMYSSCGAAPPSMMNISGSSYSAGNVSCFRHTSPTHPLSVLTGLNDLRRNCELCDVVLRVGQKKIHAHRNILASCSPYFRAMFTREMAEASQKEITLRDIDEAAMETLIEFCYTARISIEESNVQALLPAACLLQLTEIQTVCCEFLKNQLDPNNCLGIRAFADTHGCSDLLNFADRYAQNYFQDVMSSEEFLLLPVTQLMTIISKDELNIRSEEQVYQAILNWLQYDLPGRQQDFPTLLQHVRLPLLSPGFLVNRVSLDPLIRQDDRCRDLVDEAKDYLLLPADRPNMQGPRTRPRKPMVWAEVLYAVGGWCSGDAIASVERFDPHRNEWSMVAQMNKRRCGVGVAVLNDLLYAVGGHDGQSYLNSVERYDPHTNQWSAEVAPTSSCRTSVGVAVMDNFMYAVGGQDGVSCLNFVERYDPHCNKWIKVPNMNCRRLGVGVSVLDGQLYAVGGSDGTHPLSTVEMYDPRTSRWSKLNPMNTSRKHLGVAVYQGMVYAVGGRDDSTELSSVECYEPRTCSWSPVVAMTSRRSGVGLAVVNGLLTAIGGFDGSAYLKNVEVYDPDYATWRPRGNMNSRRLGGGVGVVRMVQTSLFPHEGLPNFVPQNMQHMRSSSMDQKPTFQAFVHPQGSGMSSILQQVPGPASSSGINMASYISQQLMTPVAGPLNPNNSAPSITDVVYS